MGNINICGLYARNIHFCGSSCGVVKATGGGKMIVEEQGEKYGHGGLSRPGTRDLSNQALGMGKPD